MTRSNREKEMRDGWIECHEEKRKECGMDGWRNEWRRFEGMKGWMECDVLGLVLRGDISFMMK